MGAAAAGFGATHGDDCLAECSGTVMNEMRMMTRTGRERVETFFMEGATWLMRGSQKGETSAWIWIFVA